MNNCWVDKREKSPFEQRLSKYKATHKATGREGALRLHAFNHVFVEECLYARQVLVTLYLDAKNLNRGMSPSAIFQKSHVKGQDDDTGKRLEVQKPSYGYCNNPGKR